MVNERLMSRAEFEARARAYELAQQRMEDDGCPHVLPPQETRAIAESLAAVRYYPDGTVARYRPEIGSGRFGRQIVLEGPISTANRLDAKKAERTGPRIPGGNGNGRA